MTRKLFPMIFLLSACTIHEEKKQSSFPVLTVSEDEWATYEGRWLTKEGIMRFELSLKNGTVGIDSFYKLLESTESDSLASGTISYGIYSTYYGSAKNELHICLHGLSDYMHDVHFRIKKSNIPDEMCFITRGNDELLPCDNGFKPITTDWRYTLHKRSKLFTIEGYITFDEDTVDFFERNTFDRWKLTELGEFNDLRTKYKQFARVKYEGIYLKALAYSVMDTTSQGGENALVIKRILNFGNDTD